MLNTIHSPWPCYTEEEAQAIKATLLSNKVNYWTGNECRAFEEEFASWCETSYAIALANGTVALDAALRAIDIKAGDEVIVTSRTFIASVSCIVNLGAIPIFADVDSDSQNITPESIRKVISTKTKAVICVHLAGWPCDMDPIMDLATEFNFFVIEDCAQAHGALYKGRSVGSIGHIAAWSFCQDKIMTTGGEGGMVTTNNEEFWSKMWSYKDHGKSWKAVYSETASNEFKWVHESFGTNLRMTEIQAVIGRIQLGRMKNWHEKRIHNAKTIWQVAKNLRGLRVPTVPDAIEHGAYKCYVFVNPQELNNNWNRDLIIKAINDRGVFCQTGSCSEVYLEKAFDDNWRPQKRLPIAQQLGETSLLFLIHPTMTKDMIDKTCSVLIEVMKEAASYSFNSIELEKSL